MGFQRGEHPLCDILIGGGVKTAPAKWFRLFSFAEYLAACCKMKVRRTLRSLGEGGWKGFGEFRKDNSELGSEELY